jgi:hypothetical protein
MLNNPWPFVCGIAVLFLLWFLYALITKDWNPLKIIEGADGNASASKLQYWLWTAVALFSYTALYASRLLDVHSADAIGSIPHNLLIAMGLSIVTATGAKTITSSYVQSGKVAKTASKPVKDLSPLFLDDDGCPDLSKMQMLAWTVIAIGVYLTAVGFEIGSKDPAKLAIFPDIDPALMVLMGLGQGAYLGKKLVTTSTPRLTGLSAATGSIGSNVTISGLSLGDKDGGQVTMDGKPIDSSLVTSWTDTSVQFSVPRTNPDGNGWPAQGQQVSVGIISNGQESANKLQFVGKP